MNEKYIPCQYCKKLNEEGTKKCNWCYATIPTKWQRRIQAIIFWSSIAAILGSAYVAYQIGGWS